VLQNEDHQRLTQRVEANGTLRSIAFCPFVRKILYTVSERNAAADEGAPPDNHDNRALRFAMTQVLCVAGARPNFMKIAPVMAALAETGIAAQLLHTASAL